MESNRKPRHAAPAKAARLRVLVVDDHPLVREGLAELVNEQPDLVCCGKAGTADEAEQMVAAHLPDLVVLDLRLGPTNGLDLLKSLKARLPDLRVLVLSQLDEAFHAEKALRAGAAGYVMKEQATDELLAAMRAVLSGRLYLSPNLGVVRGSSSSSSSCSSSFSSSSSPPGPVISDQ